MNDCERYNVLVHQFIALLEDDRHETELFHKTWEEIEQIKNRNGGLPPDPLRGCQMSVEESVCQGS